VKKLSGIVRYKTWRGLPPIPMGAPDPYDRFVRMSELVFENLELCLNGTTRDNTLWTPASESVPGFNEMDCVILDEEPQYDLVRDVPVQQYKYFAIQPKYVGGHPEYDDSDDVFMDIYMFNYKVPVIDGEDWYLGHHVREGRISKQMGRNRHYQTWKTWRVPEEPNSPLEPNRFYRITELGLPAAAKNFPKPDDPPRPRIAYAQSPLGNVLGEWRNILIDPAEVQDLLE
ncbi:hypothetical protein OAW22_06990, partial [Pseudomonadales bacterium]|nr:hypothetical protein [Pseudomonadales bacterium]